jgi:hypothetical protein
MAAQAVNWNVPRCELNAQHRFCALGFRCHGENALGREPLTIIVVFIDPVGRLRIFVHPEIRNMYRGDDLEYIDALVWDLVERGKMAPEDVIKHLCSVSGIGSLVPTHTDDSYADASLLTRLNANMVEV